MWVSSEESALCKVRKRLQDLSLPSLWLWISQPPELWEINVCCLSHLVCGVILQVLSWLRLPGCGGAMSSHPWWARNLCAQLDSPPATSSGGLKPQHCFLLPWPAPRRPRCKDLFWRGERKKSKQNENPFSYPGINPELHIVLSYCVCLVSFNLDQPINPFVFLWHFENNKPVIFI